MSSIRLPGLKELQERSDKLGRDLVELDKKFSQSDARLFSGVKACEEKYQTLDNKINAAQAKADQFRAEKKRKEEASNQSQSSSSSTPSKKSGPQ